MQKYDIVIVDTGIDLEHSIFKNIDNICGYEVVFLENEMRMNNEYVDEIGHGTAVAGIISSNSPQAKICIIKIFENDFNVSLERLIFALRFIAENIECRLINLSLGILDYSLELDNICKTLSKKGCIIVSAFDNDGAVSYPAAFDSVISVDMWHECTKPDQIIVEPNHFINVFAYGYNHRVAWLDNSYAFVRGSSFSAAYITAKLFNGYIIKHKKSSLDKAKSYLARISTQKSQDKKKFYTKVKNRNNEDLPKIKNAALCPYNKEMHSLVNFSHMLSFTIKHIYDVKQMGKVGSVVQGIQSREEFTIESIENIDWSSIDTLIIGHFDQISALGLNGIKHTLLEKCLKNHINVYTFDIADTKKYTKLFFKKGIWISYPNIEEKMPQKKSGKLYSIQTPVLGIFGTSSNQGKFTLQLQLRKYFLDNSYTVGQLGTEPSSLLFGMDEVFAYGYSSHLQLEQISMFEKINDLLHNIDKQENDIILVGGQSGTIPVYSFNLKYFNLYSLNVLMATNPDGIVLCINLFDSIEYLTRCINAIASLIDCKVIALAISPITHRNTWQQINGARVLANTKEISEFKSILKEKFNLKSYVIGTEEIIELYNECINYY